MVVGKPLPPALIPGQGPASNNPSPHSATPGHAAPESSTDTDDVYSPSLLYSPAFNLSNLEDVQRSGDNPWAHEEDKGGLPPSLRVGAGRKSVEKARDDESLPASLCVGPPGNLPRRSQEFQLPDTAAARSQPPWAATEASNQRSSLPQTLNNPYFRMDNSQRTPLGIESSAAIWGGRGTDPDGKSASFCSPKMICKLQANHLIATPPIELTASLSVSDRPFSEFSPSYRPPAPSPGLIDNNSLAPGASQPRQGSIPISPRDESPNPTLIADSPPATPNPPTRPKLSERQSTTTSVTSAGTGRSGSSIGWDPGMDISTFDAFTSRGHGLEGVGEVDEPELVHRTFQEQKEWDKKERERKEIELAAAAEQIQRAEQERRAEEEWHKGEEDALRQAEQKRRDRAAEASIGSGIGQAPPLPRRSQDGTPSLPRRGPAEGASYSAAASRAAPNTPAAPSQTQAPKGTNETYQIKQINWFDATSPKNPRQSPILVQNANGPCPLLALVNALTLSTPAGIETALVETLRVREQVSLGLLLSAVFDELMSGRRGDAAQELPDVSELYEFLVTLHTGMNVNPRFVPQPPKPPNLMDASPDLQQPETHSNDRDKEAKPGIFESTREMRLYSTFSVPLIHAWLPPHDHPAYISLDRSAKTYEDAQNLLFREEELVEKFERTGLSPDEQTLFGDIEIIKDFLLQSATQLTSFGLETLVRSLKPGEIAILFRNDHFSTLYKHPQSHQLLTLVTDMGYAGHPEVVWESLVDVSGEGAEFFSGDFRPVGHVLDSNSSKSRGTGGQQVRSLLDDGENWTTVERSSRRGNRENDTRNSAVGSIGDRLDPPSNPNRSSATVPLGSPNTEQEDHDLALALQLQEEEEDRHRREVAARQREDALSRQFLSGQPRPNAASAQSQQGTRARQQDIRPLIPPRREAAPDISINTNPVDVPPPTYEQAANSAPYHPPIPHRRAATSPTTPHHEHSAYYQQSQLMGSSGGTTPRRGSRGGQIRAQAQGLINEAQGATGVRRRSTGGHTHGHTGHLGSQAQEVEAGKKDCVVM
jgi:ubiquitin carboxyl-terminal hydrolase MINDY-1/2